MVTTDTTQLTFDLLDYCFKSCVKILIHIGKRHTFYLVFEQINGS